MTGVGRIFQFHVDPVGQLVALGLVHEMVGVVRAAQALLGDLAAQGEDHQLNLRDHPVGGLGAHGLVGHGQHLGHAEAGLRAQGQVAHEGIGGDLGVTLGRLPEDQLPAPDPQALVVLLGADVGRAIGIADVPDPAEAVEAVQALGGAPIFQHPEGEARVPRRALAHGLRGLGGEGKAQERKTALQHPGGALAHGNLLWVGLEKPNRPPPGSARAKRPRQPGARCSQEDPPVGSASQK